MGVHAATVNTDNQPLAQTSVQKPAESQTAVNDDAQASNGSQSANSTANVSSSNDTASLKAEAVSQTATPKAKKTVSRSTEYRETKTNTKVKKTDDSHLFQPANQTLTLIALFGTSFFNSTSI